MVPPKGPNTSHRPLPVVPRRSPTNRNARIGDDKALERPNRARHGAGAVMTAVLKDETELFKQFIDSESFRPWRRIPCSELLISAR